MDIQDLHRYLEKMDAESKANHKETQQEFRKVNETLVGQSKDLKYHIKRTDLLEDSVGLLRKDVNPIATHVDRIQFALKAIKVVGVPAILAGLAYLAKTLAGG